MKKKKGKKQMEENIKNPEEMEGVSEEAKDATEETGNEVSAGEQSEAANTEAKADEGEGTENAEAGAEEEAKKDPKDQRIEELEDMVKRQLAEFDNFRKRTDKEKETMFEAGARSVIEKLLPVVDNFERGLASIPEEEQGSAHAEGMQMIYKQMTDELDKIGVKPIEAVGQPFDPNFHNAVMQVESEEYESGTVAQELQKGYMYHDTLVRPSMVGVVQ